MPEVQLDKALLRALAHPVRLNVLAVLRQHGPATASGIARALDIHPGSASYHLRRLAEHGFVVEAPGRGNPRERWWRPAHQQQVHDPAAVAPEDREESTAYVQAVALAAADRLRAAATELPFLPREWADAGVYTDLTIRLAPGEARRMKDDVLAVLARYRRPDTAAPAGAAPLTVQFQVFPATGGAAARR